MVEVTPYGIARIGWRFYVVWAVFNLSNAIIVWLFYPETGGLTLETVDRVFAEGFSESDSRRLPTAASTAAVVSRQGGSQSGGGK